MLVIKISSGAFFQLHGAMLIARLARVRIELGPSQTICDVIVHRNENLARLHGWRHKRGAFNPRASRNHDNETVGSDAGLRSVCWVDLDVGFGRIERPQHGGFGCARVRVPLRRSAPAGEKNKRKFEIGWLRYRTGRIENKSCLAVGVEESAVSEQATLLDG